MDDDFAKETLDIIQAKAAADPFRFRSKPPESCGNVDLIVTGGGATEMRVMVIAKSCEDHRAPLH